MTCTTNISNSLKLYLSKIRIYLKKNKSGYNLDHKLWSIATAVIIIIIIH